MTTSPFKMLFCRFTSSVSSSIDHPSAKACTIEAAKVVLDAAVKAGAPEGIIGWIDVPSLELTNQVMRDSDIILATGGPGMVKAAYSSGKPALGCGLMIIAFLVFKQISVLKIAVDVGFVVGITAATSPRLHRKECIP